MASNLFLLIIVVIVIIFLARRVLAKPNSGTTIDVEPEAKSGAEIKAEVAEKEQTIAEKSASAASKVVEPVIDPDSTSSAQAEPSPMGAELPDELASLVAELEKTKDPVARHRLYQQITESSYKNRTDAAWREISKTFSKQHIGEFSNIVKPLKKANGGSLPQVLTFQNYATLLAEDNQFDEAIAVCEQALAFGLDDKTKTGFAGRVERIKKQQAKA